MSYTADGDRGSGYVCAAMDDVSDASNGTQISARYLASGVGTNGDSGWYVPTSPIPEPETYALMLAGLGLLGFAVRRRRQAEAVPA